MFAVHQRLILDCCVSALGSYFLLSHFVPVVMPAPRASGLTGRRVGDGPPAAPLAWGTSSGSVGGGPSEIPWQEYNPGPVRWQQPGVSNRHTQENRYDCISFGWLIQHCFPSLCYQALGVQAIGVQAVGVQAIGVDIGLLTGQVRSSRKKTSSCRCFRS